MLSSVIDGLIREKNVRDAMLVTIIGKLQSRNPSLTDVKGHRDGMFGHLGVYPAQIVVQEIRVIEAVAAPNFPSNMQPNRRTSPR